MAGVGDWMEIEHRRDLAGAEGVEEVSGAGEVEIDVLHSVRLSKKQWPALQALAREPEEELSLVGFAGAFDEDAEAIDLWVWCGLSAVDHLLSAMLGVFACWESG